MCTAKHGTHDGDALTEANGGLLPLGVKEGEEFVAKGPATDGDSSGRRVEGGLVELAHVDGEALLEFVELRCKAMRA